MCVAWRARRELPSGSAAAPPTRAAPPLPRRTLLQLLASSAPAYVERLYGSVGLDSLRVPERHADEQLARRLIAAGAPVNTAGPGAPALELALRYGRPRLAAALLELGAEIRADDPYRLHYLPRLVEICTAAPGPVFFASPADFPGLARSLAAAGAEVHAAVVGPLGEPLLVALLRKAAERGLDYPVFVELFEALVELGADVDTGGPAWRALLPALPALPASAAPGGPAPYRTAPHLSAPRLPAVAAQRPPACPPLGILAGRPPAARPCAGPDGGMPLPHVLVASLGDAPVNVEEFRRALRALTAAGVSLNQPADTLPAEFQHVLQASRVLAGAAGGCLGSSRGGRGAHLAGRAGQSREERPALLKANIFVLSLSHQIRGTLHQRPAGGQACPPRRPAPWAGPLWWHRGVE